MRSKLRHDNLLDLLRCYLRKLNIGQIIIGVAIVSLSIWCLINIRIIMKKYYEYETIVTLKSEQPVSTGMPGITICAPSIFTPQKLAELYPKFNESLTAFIKWRREHAYDSSYDYNMTALNIRYNEHRKYESMAMTQFTASEIINKLSVQPGEILSSCSYHPVNIRNFQMSLRENQHVVINATDCFKIQPVLQSIFEGRKCFTIFSDLVKINKVFWSSNKQFSSFAEYSETEKIVQPTIKNCTPLNSCTKQSSREEKKKWSHEFEKLLDGTSTNMVFDLNPSIELQIKPLESTSLISYSKGSIIMTVHPSNQLMNRRDFMFFQVQQISFYEIQFTKKITHLMEPPFKTACVNYTSNPKYIEENVRTRDHCISYCINHMKNLECANYFSVLINSVFTGDLKEKKICNHSKQSYNEFLEYRAECELKCDEDCEKVIFEINGQSRLLDGFCTPWYGDSTPQDGQENTNSETVLQEYGYKTRLSSGRIDQLKLFKPLRKWSPSTRQHSEKFVDKSNTYSSYFSTVKENKLQSYIGSSLCNAKVTIKLSPKPIVTVEHQQAISYENMLGSIGGHLGIWLSLSLYKIIKFVVHVLYNVLHKLVRKFSPNFLTQNPLPRH